MINLIHILQQVIKHFLVILLNPSHPAILHPALILDPHLLNLPLQLIQHPPVLSPRHLLLLLLQYCLRSVHIYLWPLQLYLVALVIVDELCCVVFGIYCWIVVWQQLDAFDRVLQYCSFLFLVVRLHLFSPFAIHVLIDLTEKVPFLFVWLLARLLPLLFPVLCLFTLPKVKLLLLRIPGFQYTLHFHIIQIFILVRRLLFWLLLLLFVCPKIELFVWNWLALSDNIFILSILYCLLWPPSSR